MPKLPAVKVPEPTITFDEPAIRAHVEMLHKLAAGLVGKFVVSTFFANPTGEDKAGGIISHHPVGDADGMFDAVMAHAETPNANVYICPNLMRPSLERGKKGAEADVAAVLALVADMDDDTGRSGHMPIDPNYVVESSPGNFQCFLLLDKPLAPAEAKPLAAALKRAAGSDHCTMDVSHVWRVPGCLNWPNRKKLERGRPADPVAVEVDLDWDGSLTEVEELRAALEPWWSAPTAASAVSLGDLPSADGIELSETAASMLAADDVGDRSEHAARVVEQLAFDGLTAEQACAVFLAATGNWFARYATKDAGKDFTRLWGKYGTPHAEERERGAQASAGIVAKFKSSGTTPVPANDNVPITDTPAMHPNPFTPEAAGGLLESVATWVNDTAIVPVRELSLAAAIALLGGCFGKLAIGPTNAGVNIYFATLLDTAGGKGHPPKAIRTLSDQCGAQGCVSNGDPTSYAAIERMLRKSISTVAVLDEFGILLQDINGKHQNSASASIRKMLLAIFDQSNSVFDGRIYANAETKKDDGPLVGPALTVLAMTTPSTLYAGLSAASISDGFINRFVFVTGARVDGAIRVPRLDVDLKPPSPLVASLQNAIQGFPKSTKAGSKYKIPFEGGEQGEAYQRWGEVFLWQHRDGRDETYKDIDARAAENTVRLATIRAISRDARRPSITLDDVEWAWAIVYRSIELIATGVSRHMSSSPAEALRKCIVEVLREAPDHTIAYSSLLRRKGVRGSDLREVDGALQYLMESGEVRIIGRPKPGAGSKFQLLDLATELAA